MEGDGPSIAGGEEGSSCKLVNSISRTRVAHGSVDLQSVDRGLDFGREFWCGTYEERILPQAEFENRGDADGERTSHLEQSDRLGRLFGFPLPVAQLSALYDFSPFREEAEGRASAPQGRRNAEDAAATDAQGPEPLKRRLSKACPPGGNISIADATRFG